MKYIHSPFFTIGDLSIPSSGGPWRNICRAILNSPALKSLIETGVRRKLDRAHLHIFGMIYGWGLSLSKLNSPRSSPLPLSLQQQSKIADFGMGADGYGLSHGTNHSEEGIYARN